jgi:hypothetical protein
VVLLTTLVVFLHQVVHFALFDLCHLFLQFFFKLTQYLALAKSLADAPDSAYVLGVLLGSDEVELVLLFALGLQVLLVFEGFEYVFQVDLGRGRRLGAWRFVPECLHLL